MSTYSCKSLGQIAAVPVALLQNGIAEALFVGMEGQFRSRVYIYIFVSCCFILYLQLFDECRTNSEYPVAKVLYACLSTLLQIVA